MKQRTTGETSRRKLESSIPAQQPNSLTLESVLITKAKATVVMEAKPCGTCLLSQHVRN